MMKAKAKDVMTSPAIVVRPETTIDDALELLLRHRVSGLPVVDAEDRLVGVVSEFDLLTLLYDNLRIENTTVSRYLSSDVVTVHEDDHLIDVAQVFLEKGLRRLPVIKAGKVVGVISRRDVIRYIRDLRRQVSQEFHTPPAALGSR